MNGGYQLMMLNSLSTHFMLNIYIYIYIYIYICQDKNFDK